VPPDHDGSLPYVKAAKRAYHFERHVDVGLILGQRRFVAQCSHSREEIGRHVASSMHPIAFVLEETNNL
jgi:hypothetical protein